MRKSVILLMVTVMSLTFAPLYASGPTDPPKTENADPAAARAEHLMNRLNEIKSMDKSALTRKEKKALRKEVREIKAEMARTSNGVYLSIGAIIIIILLLILLL